MYLTTILCRVVDGRLHVTILKGEAYNHVCHIDRLYNRYLPFTLRHNPSRIYDEEELIDQRVRDIDEIKKRTSF